MTKPPPAFIFATLGDWRIERCVCWHYAECALDEFKALVSPNGRHCWRLTPRLTDEQRVKRLPSAN